MKRDPERDLARAARRPWSLRVPPPLRATPAVAPLLAGVVTVAPAGRRWYGRSEQPSWRRSGDATAKGG